MDNGLVHIYCGDGKGKTTAALGLVLRASGAGEKCLIARFLKKNNSAELDALKRLDNVEIIPNDKEFGFMLTKEAMDKAMKEAKPYYTDMFITARDKAMTGKYGLLMLDEICAATRKGFVDAGLVVDFLKNKPSSLEVVMTGRDPLDKLVECAAYVSEVKKIKHPIDIGIMARKGVEF